MRVGAGARRGALIGLLLAFLAGCSGSIGSGGSGSGSIGSVGSLGSGALGGDSICGSRAIRGEIIPDIEGPGGCGVRNPVRVASVEGVALSPQPTITCDTARALRRWVRDGARPAIARAGGRLEALHIAAHYVCRRRNHQRGGPLSEHARGHAIDIAHFRLAGGTQISVLDHWHSARWGPALQRMHRAACGIFGTTLGPGSDGFHEDHFHYDIARHRSGPYCR